MAYPIYRVTDSGSYIGSYSAKNEKLAIQFARDGLAQHAAVFRRGCPMITLKAPVATMIQDDKGNTIK